MKFVLRLVENIMGKGENAGSPFPIMFSTILRTKSFLKSHLLSRLPMLWIGTSLELCSLTKLFSDKNDSAVLLEQIDMK